MQNHDLIGSAARFFFGVILFKLLRQEGVELLWRDHVVQVLVDVGHDPAQRSSAPDHGAVERLASEKSREWDEYGSGMSMDDLY